MPLSRDSIATITAKGSYFRFHSKKHFTSTPDAFYRNFLETQRTYEHADRFAPPEAHSGFYFACSREVAIAESAFYAREAPSRPLELIATRDYLGALRAQGSDKILLQVNLALRDVADLTDASTVEHCFREGRIRYRRAPPEYWVQYLMRLIVLEPGGDSISDALGMDLMDAEFSGVLFPSVRALGNDLKQQFGIRQNTDDEGRIRLGSNANIMDLHWQLEEQMKRERNLVAFSGSNVTRAIAHYSWEDADGGRGEEANPYYEVSAEQLESVRLTERDRLGLDPRAAADAGLIPDAWMRAEFPCNVMWVRDE